MKTEDLFQIDRISTTLKKLCQKSGQLAKRLNDKNKYQFRFTYLYKKRIVIIFFKE
jgi:hypothetical protein